MQGIVPTMIIVMSVLGLTAGDFESAATRRGTGAGAGAGTTHMSTMRFEHGRTVTFSTAPGLTTDTTTSGFASYADDSALDVRKGAGAGAGEDVKMEELAPVDADVEARPRSR